VATAGVSVLVGAVVYLISTMNDAQTKAEEMALKAAEYREKFSGKLLSEVERSLQRQERGQSIELARAKLHGEDMVKLERKQFIERLALLLDFQQTLKYNYETGYLTKAQFEEQSYQLEKMRLDLLQTQRDKAAKRKEESDKEAERKKQVRDERAQFSAEQLAEQAKENAQFIEQQQKDFDERLLAESKKTQDGLTANLKTGGEERLNETIKQTDDEIAAHKKKLEQMEKNMQMSLAFASSTAQGMNTIVNNFYAQDFQRLEAARDRDLKNAGENAKQKEAIEKRFAIERAKIERQQAISNKIFGITQVILDTIQAISAANKLGFPANIPAMALAAAQGAIQTAAIVSQPIPEIPKFEEGGFVARALKGGQIRPDGFIEGKSHRHGGVLIEAEGREFITNKTATSKYFDELKAANSLQLEEHINRKYVSPAVERARAESSLYEYDDEGLRADVRNNVRATQSAAKYIVKGVGKELRESSYLLSRYG